MVVIVDIDNILNNLTDKLVAFYNTRNGKNIQVSDMTTYDFSKCLSPEDVDGILALLKDKTLWDSLEPILGSQKGLQKLIHHGFEVYLATATLAENFPWKVEWCAKYFPFIESDHIIRIINKGLLKADIMVDDCLDNLISNICERVTLDYPWNRDETKSYAYDIHRAYTFEDIVNIILDIERKYEEWKNQ